MRRRRRRKTIEERNFDNKTFGQKKTKIGIKM